MFYDRSGRPIDLVDWAAKLQDGGYKTLAQAWIRGGHDRAIARLRQEIGAAAGDVIPAGHLAGAVVPPDDISGLLA